MLFTSGRTVTVSRYDTDAFGDRVLTDQFDVPDCAVAPENTEEDNDRAVATVTSGVALYDPHYADFRAADEVDIGDGQDWQVEGDPAPWESPFSMWEPGQVVHLVKRSG